MSTKSANFLIHLITASNVSSFEDSDEDGQPQGQRDEEKVKNGRGGEISIFFHQKNYRISSNKRRILKLNSLKRKRRGGS